MSILFDEVRLNDDVTVLKRFQAEPVAVCLPLGLCVVRHVQLAMLLEVRSMVADLALPRHLLVG